MDLSSVSDETRITDLITRSLAFRQANSSDNRACCANRFAESQLSENNAGYRDCPAHRFCEYGKIVIPIGVRQGPFRRPPLPTFRIPRLVPLVNPLDERTFSHRYLDGAFPMVAVQLWKLVRSGPAYRTALSKGLNQMLKFDGKILISSVMPDDDIVGRGVDWFIRVIKELKPDAVTTWDVPTYSDHPKRASLNWLLAGLEGARRMSLELDTPMIGLVAGADLSQVELSSTCLREVGFEHQALACHELLLARQHAYLKSCASAVAKNCSDLTLLSCSHPNLFEKFKMADHFVGMSWFHQAVRGRRLGNRASWIAGDRRKRTAHLIGENVIETIQALRESFPNDVPRGV